MLNRWHGGEKMNLEIKEGNNRICFGELKSRQEALDRLNHSFFNGSYTKYLLGDVPVVLIEGSFVLGTKEHPVRITGKGVDRKASLI